MFMCVWMDAQVEARGWCWLSFPYCFPTYFLRYDLLLNLELTISTRPNGPWAPRICLFPHASEHWCDEHTLPCMRSSCMQGKHLVYLAITLTLWNAVFWPDLRFLINSLKLFQPSWLENSRSWVTLVEAYLHRQEVGQLFLMIL